VSSIALVSVVVPVFNGAQMLGDAIRSILAQDYEPIEIVVVDDGSVDDSFDVARSFPSVRCLRQENAGPALARNSGIAVATGEFIGFLDADDVMRPSKVSTQMRYLAEHPLVGCVLTHQEVRLEAGAPSPQWMAAAESGQSADSASASSSSAYPAVQALTALVRRSAAEPVGWFDPSMRLSDDVDWLMRLREAGVGIAVIPERLLVRRVHGSNISYETSTSQQELLRSVSALIRRRQT
jgi:glycosyltransferase involved in cell wall biosynthesis